MVKDHTDSERGHPLPPNGLLFAINRKVFLYASSHRQDNTYHGHCYTSRGALAGMRNRIQKPYPLLLLQFCSGIGIWFNGKLSAHVV